MQPTSLSRLPCLGGIAELDVGRRYPTRLANRGQESTAEGCRRRQQLELVAEKVDEMAEEVAEEVEEVELASPRPMVQEVEVELAAPRPVVQEVEVELAAPRPVLAAPRPVVQEVELELASLRC